MSSITNIKRRLCIKVENLNSGIKDYILEKMKLLAENDCTKEEGYIIDVKKIVTIKDNYISNANSEVVFNIIFEVETIKPEKDKVVEGKICMIFPGGIFIIVKDKLRVLIPVSELKDYNYVISNNLYENKKDEKDKIQINDNIKVQIIGSRYSNKSFSCFGKMI